MKGARRQERQVTGVKKRRRKDTVEDEVMNEGSKKAGKASDRGKEEKEGR